MKKITITIVDDHALFRNGLKILLDTNPEFKVIGEAINGKEFLDNLDNNMPDIVLMDINMPVMDGIEATQLANEKYPDIKIVALSMFGEEEYYYKMINAGVKGFLLKNSEINEVIEAIKQVNIGNSYF